MDLIKSGTSKVVNYAKLQKYLFTNKDGVQVLSKQQFGDDVAAVLKSKRFDKLRKYATMFNEKNPNKQISLIGTLTTRYGDDAVAKALVTAKQPDSTKAIATKLQTQQLQGWFDNTKSVDDVFKILKLSDDGPTVMMSRKLETLDPYVKLFNSNQSSVKDTTNSFRVLRKGFGGDSKFAFVVSSALAAPATETMYTTAFKYQNKLFKRWLNSELDPTKVLTKVFKVDKVADGTWVGSFVKRYTTYYNKEMRQPVGF